MAKNRKGPGQRAFSVPILVARTPEQHRAIIQPPRADSTPIASKRRSGTSHPPKQIRTKGPRPPRSRAKRKRLANMENGTRSIAGRVHVLGYRSYSDYLASPHWLDVRERWKASNMFKGWVCHSFGCISDGRLSLHHWTYERMGREELTDLILVCDGCHRRIHRLEKGGMALDEATRFVTNQRLTVLASLPHPNTRNAA